MKNADNMSNNKANEEDPPIMGTWSRIYLLVIIIHFVIIGLFILFTNYYS